MTSWSPLRKIPTWRDRKIETSGKFRESRAETAVVRLTGCSPGDGKTCRKFLHPTLSWMVELQCLGSEPTNIFRESCSTQGMHLKIHGPSQPRALWKGWENQWTGRIEAGVEKTQGVDLTWRPWWDHRHLRGHGRDREQYPWPSRILHHSGSQKDRGWPWTSCSHSHCPNPLKPLLSPDSPEKEEKEKGGEEMPTLTEP